MNILVVQETDWIKKGPLQQHHLMERLRKRGHNIHVIDFEVLWKEGHKLYSKRKVFYVSRTIDDIKITIIRPAFLRLPFLVYLSVILTHTLEIFRQIKEFKPDVVIGFDIPNSYFAFKIARCFKIPSVYYLIDINYLFVPEKILQPMAKAIELQTVKIADVIITINDMLKDFYVKNMGADKLKTAVIRAGIDARRFNPDINGSRIREKYGIDKKDVLLFFMGWLYPFSGLTEVAYSLQEYHGKPEIRLLIVGKGELYEELHRLKIGGLGDRLILVKWQPYDKIPEFIAASDVCLLPAHNNEVMRNIVPIKMYEYMACGKPIIATKLPGIMKEFRNGNGVIYVEHPENILAKTVELIHDNLLEKHGYRAKQLVENLTWDNITHDFEKILINTILNHKHKNNDRKSVI